MACVARDGKGWRIVFVGHDGARRTLRLGRVDRKTAECIRNHVEALLAAQITGQPVRRETAVWLAGLGDKLRQRLARVGLANAAPQATLGRFLEEFLAERRGYCKPASLVVWRQVVKNLLDFFGNECPLVSITPAQAEAFRQHLAASGLRDTTISKRIQHCRMFFRYAKRHRLIADNPFEFVRHRSGNAAERRTYVPVADVLRVMDYCPNDTWRLLLALSRFAGLRIPSEAFSLKWSDVDWERGRLTVPSPKTEHLPGRGYRVIPLFPLLRPYLERAWESAPEGVVYVISDEYRRRAMGPSGWRNANLRTTLEKIVRRAGLTPWPRLWHSLRASLESDLAASFPLATVTRWVGNTPTIAMRHYVDPTDALFQQATNWRPAVGPQGIEHGAEKVAQNPAQYSAENTSILPQLPNQPIPQFNTLQDFTASFSVTHPPKAERTGFEPKTVSPSGPMGYVNRPTPGGTNSGTLADENPTLERLAEALLGLPKADRRKLLRLLGEGD